MNNAQIPTEGEWEQLAEQARKAKADMFIQPATTVNIVHAFSTAWWGKAMQGADFELDTPRLYTMALSAIQAAQFGTPVCYTDAAGLRWLEKTGLAAFYKRTVEIPVLPHIDHQIFWQISKLIALAMGWFDDIICDLDLVLWEKPPQSDFIIAHVEPPDWECYRDNFDHFAEYGFSYGWNWSCAPFNTGILKISGSALREFYISAAFGFAENFSRRRKQLPLWYYEPALFAEQRLLAMVADKLYATPDTLFTLRNYCNHTELSDYGFHLWGMKRVYAQCIEPRITFLDWIRGELEKTWSGLWLLKKNGFTEPTTVDREREFLKAKGWPTIENGDADNSLMKTVRVEKGNWVAQDPNTKRFRPMGGTGKVYRGEILRCHDDGRAMVGNRTLTGPIYEYEADVIWSV